MTGFSSLTGRLCRDCGALPLTAAAFPGCIWEGGAVMTRWQLPCCSAGESHPLGKERAKDGAPGEDGAPGVFCSAKDGVPGAPGSWRDTGRAWLVTSCEARKR